ncbi:MAG: PKD domain-containing protein [Bacteroidia bacterium]
MKKLFLLALICISILSKAQTICGENGNLIIYSNYDGGIVTINVDANIPNLKIGICTYEPVQVTITGPFASNVTQVIYAGFASTQANNNCGLGDFPTTITGVNPGIIDIQVAPDAGYDNPNGWPQIIGVAGQCSASINAGGGNTPDQVVYYFLQETGGVFYAHYTQYQCWINQVYNVSAGGNCCVVPNSTCVPPQVNPGNDLSICTGQTATLGGSPTATSGSASNYTYTWFPTTGLNDPNSPNPIASPNSFTTYTVTVSTGDENCVATASVDVNVGSTQTLPVTASADLVLCANETLQLTAAPGFSNYEWSNSQSGNTITVNSAGTYTVTALGSGGCEAISDPLVVTASAPFQVDITPAGPINICGDEPVILTAEAGFTNYQWSNNQFGSTLNVTSSGGYSVSAVNADGCAGASNVVQVSLVDFPEAGFTYLQNLDQLYEIEFTNTSQNATNYLWNFGSGNTSNEANPSFIFPFDNDWPVSLIVTNSCGSDTIAQLVTVIKTSIDELLLRPISIAYTANGPIISGGFKSPENVQLQVINLNGQIVYQENLNLSNEFQIQPPLFGFAKGVYLINLNTSLGAISFKWMH